MTILSDKITPIEPKFGEASIPLLADRSTPRWVQAVAVTFGVALATCVVGVIVLTVLVQSLVAQDGELPMVPVLVGMAAILMAVMIFLEYAYSNALFGLRYVREKIAMRIQALMAVPACLICAFVHPLCGIAIPVGSFIGWVLWRLSNYQKTVESEWSFTNSEAASMLLGRDMNGLSIALRQVNTHALAKVFRTVATWSGAFTAVVASGYLTATQVLVPEAILGMALLTYWSVDRVMAHLWFQESDIMFEDALVVLPEPLLGEEPSGLNVDGLTVQTRSGRTLLADVTLQVMPGEMVAILGESGAGKSLLLHSLADPYSLTGVEVFGRVTHGSTDLWARSDQIQTVPLVYVPEEPLLLNASGRENLALSDDPSHLDRARWMLEQFVFAHDLVDKICDEPDARRLPSMQRKSLVLARAFSAAPQVVLLDRPETALGEAQISALSRRIDHDLRLGRSIVLVTDNRTLLDKCDKVFVLQHGRIVDFGPAKAVRDRIATGWARFIGRRSLTTEENLENWVRSHFRRDGDENNRRIVCRVTSEMLALSCQSASPNVGDSVRFLFKHFESHCVVKMIDSSPPYTSAQFSRAETAAAKEETSIRGDLLATVMRLSQTVEAESHQDGRMLKVKISTYDPRKTGGVHGKDVAKSKH